jgi:hypothetical protein
MTWRSFDGHLIEADIKGQQRPIMFVCIGMLQCGIVFDGHLIGVGHRAEKRRHCA